MASIGTLTVDLVAKTKRLEDGLDRADRRLRNMERRAKKSRDSLARLTKGAIGTAAAMVAFSKAADAARAIFEATERVNGLEFAMTAATGSAAEAKNQLSFVSQEAERLGLNFVVAAESFKGLTAAAKGTKLAGQGAQQIFTAVAEASAVMRLSSDQTKGALLAISQIMSKGTVQAEELRGQLSERLPSAFQIAARSMGVTTKELGKMLEKGEVIADDFLPRFAIELQKSVKGGVADAAQSATASFNRLANAWDRFLVALGRSGVVDVLQEMADAATLILKAIGPVETRFMSMADVGVSNLELLNKKWQDAEQSVKNFERALQSKELLNPKAIAILEERLEQTRARAQALHAEIVKSSKAIQKMGESGSSAIKKLDTSFQDAADSMSIAMDLIEKEFAKLDQIEAKRIALDISDITQLEQSLLTAEDRILKSYERRSQIVETAFQNDLISESKRFELLQKLHAEHQHRLTEIAERGRSEQEKFASLSFKDQMKIGERFFSDYLSTARNFNETNFKLWKGYAMAKATIDAISGAATVFKTYAANPFVAAAAAAAHLAKGYALVRQIEQTHFNDGRRPHIPGGGGRGGGSDRESTTQPEERRPSRVDIIMHNVDPVKMYSGQQLRDLLERLKGAEIGSVEYV